MDLSGILELLEGLFDGGLITGLVVLVAFLVNQLAAFLGVKFSADQKKAIVLAASVGLAILQDPFQLGDPSLEPNYLAMLAGQATVQFKAAQVIYDRIFAKMVAA